MLIMRGTLYLIFLKKKKKRYSVVVPKFKHYTETIYGEDMYEVFDKLKQEHFKYYRFQFKSYSEIRSAKRKMFDIHIDVNCIPNVYG